MADIKINDLCPAGLDFFANDESFMNELTDDELDVWGGKKDEEYSILNSNISVTNSEGNSVLNSEGNSVFIYIN